MRIFSRTLLALAMMMALVGFAAPVLAAFEYQPLENGVPGFESETASGNFVSYVESIYKLGLWIVGISALFMFSVGAFTYLSSAGNTSAMGTGKSVMKDALVGLLLALASWLLLNTINPDLVNINIGSMNASGGGGVGTGMAQEGSSSLQEGVKGDCGGLQLKGASGAQCALVSASLNSLMKCMAEKGANSLGGVTSLASNKITGTNFDELIKKSASCCGHSNGSNPGNPPYPYCPHANGSCHHGCGESDPGYVHAIDFSNRAGASSAELCKVADIAWSCGAGQVWGAMTTTCPSGKSIKKVAGHETHLHISDSECGH